MQPEDAELLFRWRSSQRVNSMMATNFTSEFKEHTSWLEAAYTKPNYYHWIIVDDEVDVGFLSINGLNLSERTTSWGYYISEEGSLGVGALIPAYFYNFIFNVGWGIQEVTAEVLETNERVIRIHALYGYTRTPDKDKSIQKNGINQNLITMKLTKETWDKTDRYKKYVSDFPRISWTQNPDHN